jgi:type I restriction enzyme S subunit
VTDEALVKINKRSKLQAGDLLFSGIGTIGRVALITETPTNWNTSESVFNMHPAGNISSEFLYILLLSDVFQQYVKLHAQGGVQQGIRMASLKEYKMAIPDVYILREFDKKVIPLVSLVKKNDNETDRLATLRDTLLPKLMSGELKVNEIENN